MKNTVQLIPKRLSNYPGHKIIDSAKKALKMYTIMYTKGRSRHGGYLVVAKPGSVGFTPVMLHAIGEISSEDQGELARKSIHKASSISLYKQAEEISKEVTDFEIISSENGDMYVISRKYLGQIVMDYLSFDANLGSEGNECIMIWILLENKQINYDFVRSKFQQNLKMQTFIDNMIQHES